MRGTAVITGDGVQGGAIVHPPWAVLGNARLRNLGFLVGMIVVGVLLHYGDTLPLLSTAAARTPISEPTRQSLERILFLFPVMFATITFGTRGGVITLAVAALIMLPQSVMSLQRTHYTVFETGGVILVGGLFILLVRVQRKKADMAGFFVRHVLEAQENERRRIALELHDSTAQALLQLCQGLDALASNPESPLPTELDEKVRGLRAVGVQTLSDLRRIVQDLRPPILDHLGLVAALEWLAQKHSRTQGVNVRVQCRGTLPELAPQVQMLLFRIAQEALQNSAKHSQAREVRITLETKGSQVKMSVVDDGLGFVLPKDIRDLAGTGRLGLLGMVERSRLMGGELTIRSTPGKGSSVIVDIPVVRVK